MLGGRRYLQALPQQPIGTQSTKTLDARGHAQKLWKSPLVATSLTVIVHGDLYQYNVHVRQLKTFPDRCHITGIRPNCCYKVHLRLPSRPCINTAPCSTFQSSLRSSLLLVEGRALVSGMALRRVLKRSENIAGVVLGVMRALIMNDSKNRRSQYNFPTPDRSPKRAP